MPHLHPSDPPPGTGETGLPLVTALQRATHVLGVHLESALADLGLSQGEIHVLSLLAGDGALSVGELQQGVRHRPSTLTGILDRLTARGLVERRINQADRRSNLIALTPDGRVAAGRVADTMAGIDHRLFEDRPATERQAFRQVLDRIAAQL